MRDRALLKAQALVIIVTLALLTLAAVKTAQGASGTFGRTGANGYMEGRRWASVVVTGAANGNGTTTISGADLAVIKNHYIQEIITTPGAGDAAPSAYTLTVADAYGRTLTTPARSASATESYDVPGALGRNWAVLGALTVTATGLGEGNTATVLVLVH